RRPLLRCPFRISARIRMGAVIVAAASAKRPITPMRTRTSRFPRVCIPVFASRVRRPQVGVGAGVSVEQLEDDVKLLVRFNTVGQKTLRAKYAKLEMVS